MNSKCVHILEADSRSKCHEVQNIYFALFKGQSCIITCLILSAMIENNHDSSLCDVK